MISKLEIDEIPVAKISHDDRGMYIVKKIYDCRYDVIQASSEVVVASAALQITADTAAKALNACAIIPRMKL